MKVINAKSAFEEQTGIPLEGKATKAAVPHKHAALIKAWADGAEIQGRCLDRYKPEWHDINDPVWCKHWEYRIKPSAPVEPDYGCIAREAWHQSSVSSSSWTGAAKAVIEAYEAHKKALEEFNKDCNNA